MVHTPEMLARRTHQPSLSGTVHLTDGAATALQMGRVDQALRIYRQLERQEGHNPTWSLRVAECYRRLAQRDGEVSALMRAASRYEERGFIREALALWRRVQMVDPLHPSARLARERLEPSRGLGLERFRSSFPPDLQHAPSHVTPVAEQDERSAGWPQPEIPAAPRLPEIEELDVPVTDAFEEEGEVDVDVAASEPAVPERPIATAVRVRAAEEEHGIAGLDDSEPMAPLAPVLATGVAIDGREERLPVTMRAADLDAAGADEIPLQLVRPVVRGSGQPSRPASSTRAAEAFDAPAPLAVVVTPVVPVLAAGPPMPELSPLPPLPIIAVGSEEEGEVEIIDAEVLPCIGQIDSDW